MTILEERQRLQNDIVDAGSDLAAEAKKVLDLLRQLGMRGRAVCDLEIALAQWEETPKEP